MIGDMSDPRVCVPCGTVYSASFGCPGCRPTVLSFNAPIGASVELPDLSDGPMPVARCKTCSSRANRDTA